MVRTRSFDIKGLLAHLTDTRSKDWSEMDGLESDVCVGHWHGHEGIGGACIDLDRSVLTVSFDDGDGSWGFDLDDLEADDPVRAFITLEPGGEDLAPA